MSTCIPEEKWILPQSHFGKPLNHCCVPAGGDKFLRMVQMFVMAEPPIARNHFIEMAKAVGISPKAMADQFAGLIGAQSAAYVNGLIPLQKLLMAAAYPVPLLVAKAQVTEEKGTALCKEEMEFRQLISVAWLDGFESVLHGKGMVMGNSLRHARVSLSQRSEVVNALLKTTFVKVRRLGGRCIQNPRLLPCAGFLIGKYY